MTAKPSTIKCPKCGYQPNIITDTCLKCGAPLQKICGDCGFANQVDKNYCGQCGALLSLQPPPKPEEPPREELAGHEGFKLEMESIQDTVSERETSFRRRLPVPPPAPEPKPQAAQPPPPPPGRGGGSGPLTPDSTRLMKEAPLPRPRKQNLIKKLSGPAVTALLLGVLFAILYLIIAPSLPKMRLVMTAKAYLADISEGKYSKAYEMLSSNSKAVCSLQDYVKNSNDYYSKAPPWQWKDVQVFAMSNDAAMIRYKLKEGDGPWKDDYISFVREHSRWMRPYIWVLFQPIDDALKRHDFPQALFLAQKLYLTDPVDPRSSAYLCTTEFFMGLYDKSAVSCKRAVDEAGTYPVGYSSDEIFQLDSRYADSLRYLQRDRAALEEYAKLLQWPGLTNDQLCPLHLNRADDYVYLKDYDRALQEVMAASEVCTAGPSKEDARKRLRYMSGAAGPDAIAFVQNSRLKPDGPTIAEMRGQQLAALRKRLGRARARYLPRDQWLAVHVAGPNYRVYLRSEALDPRTRRPQTMDIYVFLVNLWTEKAEAEKLPPASPRAVAGK